MPKIEHPVNAGSEKNPTPEVRNGPKTPPVYAKSQWTCTDCGVGGLFLDLNRDGTFSTMCDHCTLFVPTPGSHSGTGASESGPDLPWALLWYRQSEQDVYRALRMIGSKANPARVMPADISEWLRKRYAELEPNPLRRKEAPRVTVSHALTKLHRAGFVQRTVNGWVACEFIGAKGGA